MSVQEPELQIRRLFIGNISKALAENPSDVQDRISKFGSIKSDLELHHNEVKGLSFGFLDIELGDKDYTRLKNALNGVNYKGSKLVIDIAKENFESRWEKDHNRPNEFIQAKNIKKQYEFWKKLQNINKTFKDQQEIIHGRMRNQRKKDFKKMTFRVKFNGETKIIRCFKTKLWGYEKNKPLRDLVYKFSHNVWKDGNDHIVERLTTPLRLTSQNGQTLTIEKIDDDSNINRDDLLLKDLGDDEDMDEDEQEKNNKVLASLLGTFDFDKPMELNDDDNEEFGHSDYEYEGAFKDDDESDEDTYKNQNKVVNNQVEYVKEGEFANEKTVNFDDDDEEDEEGEQDQMDIDQPEEEQDIPENEDEDHEFIPTFGASKPEEEEEEEEKEKVPQVSEGTISNTETLRTLFNTEDQGTFKLIEESDDDIDQSKKTVADDVIIPESNITSIIAPKLKNKKGLFFPHFDSPFLVAQTQLNKLNTNVNFEEWENQFWDKRSEWTKEFKRRKRDVLRQLRKKNARNARVVL
ncbi:Polyadenylate-binding protein 1-B [Wickerhamomyces ciferrii]|uniref:Polyadenylate-binding protein 1-B n=1 Tax=Wickerhamomyces ciferrii (strain ATCC 14091 / BCRC 22168 / CBS 111 / JCM 3599 / NBRC 0793 / NRRL Y-1031 F-60-10) TaxID=1206466 RepID=K0KM63_WICCF|nr:Polyadenylate-binding protein 1-B [Wickerhamomyces ciferrii]CCH43267.1 Polyadenylate-binding protein 1-B [Wickerhamomyces ciferrii]